MASPDHKVGTHFEALDEGVLVAASKSIETFLPFQLSLNCGGTYRSVILVSFYRSVLGFSVSIPWLIKAFRTSTVAVTHEAERGESSHSFLI